MKYRIARWIFFSLAVGLVPTWAYALTVTVSWGFGEGESFTFPEGAATINLDSDSPVGAPRAYGPFTIAKCPGCGGRARVFVSDGDIDRLILTDALIRNTGSTTATLRISIDSGNLSVSGPAGMYPYAVELSGSFVAPLGQSATTPAGNNVRVRSRACSVGNEGCATIDSPQVDPGEDGEGPNFSVVAPPYLVAGTSAYGPKEWENIDCSGFFPESEGDSTNSCLPSLLMNLEVTLRPGHSARLPGSAGAFHVGDRCEPENGLLVGCEKLADLFASLGHKGFRVQETRLEPSPGGTPSLDFRFHAQHSTQEWRTHRDGGNANEGINSSSTIVTLDSGGTGELRAKGLCPVDGCLDAGTVLPVRLFCGEDNRSTTAITLNNKGDGKAELAFGVPCLDPAVLIMDESDNAWVAAPLVK